VDGVLATIRRHGLLAGGDTVLVAVSGGADSVALLHALRLLGPMLPLSLHVIHVHHGRRQGWWQVVKGCSVPGE